MLATSVRIDEILVNGRLIRTYIDGNKKDITKLYLHASDTPILVVLINFLAGS
jgi:hypothetical protein